MAVSKCRLSTPMMMDSSSAPWAMVRMLTPCSPSARKSLPEMPGRKVIFRPTAATRAMPSCTCTSSGRQSLWILATMW